MRDCSGSVDSCGDQVPSRNSCTRSSGTGGGVVPGGVPSWSVGAAVRGTRAADSCGPGAVSTAGGVGASSGPGVCGDGVPVSVEVGGVTTLRGPGSFDGYRSELCAAGTASSTRPTEAPVPSNSGRERTVLTKYPAPRTPALTNRAQPRGRRYPSTEAFNSTLYENRCAAVCAVRWSLATEMVLRVPCCRCQVRR